MPSDYEAIRQDNIIKYGTDIARIGKMLLADRYDDRAHFIYELLQNTEDALGRRIETPHSRQVKFKLDARELRLTHYGELFSEKDVKGVCGIAESTKSGDEIGKFGIGFKSVYTFSESPEIHSGSEHFAIEDYVKPKSVNIEQLEESQTLIRIPLLADDADAIAEISRGLERLGTRSLLFLKQIEEIEWTLPNGHTGIILRSAPKVLDTNVRMVTLIGHKDGEEDTDESWLVFNQQINSIDDDKKGWIELAFNIIQEDESKDWTIRSVSHSPLIVYFPTVLSTNLGFLLQGPFRTTPSRDNIPKGDVWNKQLVRETGALLARSLGWLRDNNWLSTATLECLPLDKREFQDESLFAPIFESVKELLIKEKLLPTNANGFTSASHAKLARTKELRELFSPIQLAQLFGFSAPIYWLSGEITADRTPTLRRYCINELNIQEVTPELAVSVIDFAFLESQSDDWMIQFYRFLESQAALHKKLENIPFIRLENGTHVVANVKGQPQAFIPGDGKTTLPTVKIALCQDERVLHFLAGLGVTAPDPVDDVVQSILPKYAKDEVSVTDNEYSEDIERIVHAFGSDSKIQKDKLTEALKDCKFIKALDAGSNEGRFVQPTEVHLATKRLNQLLDGVVGLFLVDIQLDCLKGESVRELLEACGAVRHLRPIKTNGNFLSSEEREEIRKKDGREKTSGINDLIMDHSLEGLDGVLQQLSQLASAERVIRSKLLWESLIDLEDRRGHGVFQGEYRWSYYGHSKAMFPSHFIRHLRKSRWVPDKDGELHEPGMILFDSLAWNDNLFLRQQIGFRPPAIDELALEVGIEPEALNLLKLLGLTNADELRSRLGLEEEPEPKDDVYGRASDLYGDLPETENQEKGHNGDNQESIGDYSGSEGNGSNAGSSSRGQGTGGKSSSSGAKGKRPADSVGGRPFISYLGAEPEEGDGDPDGLDHEARMNLESQAIDLILSVEPTLEITPAGNPGFDLLETNESGDPIRWVEVKAMTGTLRNRPVGLSQKQFKFAQKEKSGYWLYIVEQAGNPENARILRIQDPATKARTFTFDYGWENIASDV